MSEKLTVLTEGTIESAYDYDIIINNVTWPNNIREDLRLDRTILEDEFSTQAEKYAYYSTLAALARDQEAKLKRVMDHAYATADSVARMDAKAAKVADPKLKFTEMMYETVAKTSEGFQHAQLAYLEAKKLADLLRFATEAFSQRKEMLISLGAHARTGASDVRVMGAHVRNNIQREEEEETEEPVKTSRRKPKKQQ